jgi:hypothetical protein
MTFDEAFRSAEYCEEVSQKKAEIEWLIKLCKEYAVKFDQERISIVEKIARWQGAKGETTMERGYYDPSPVHDLLVGNTCRNTLLKKNEDLSLATMQYGFDYAGRLSYVLRHKGTKYEKHEGLFYEGERVLGLTKRPSGEIEALTLCEFKNGNINKYVFLYRATDWKFVLQKEEYWYDGGKLLRMKWTEASENEYILPERYLVRSDEYYLRSDEKGYFSQAQRIAYWGPIPRDVFDEDRWWPIKKKRRLDYFKEKVLSVYIGFGE